MAQGSTYTRQARNQLQQSRLQAMAQAQALKDAEEAKRIAEENDPRRKKLAELIAYSTSERAKYDKLYQETGDKNYSRKSDDIRRKYQDKIKTVERAIAKDITISQQRSSEKSNRAYRSAKLAQTNQKNVLTQKFGSKVYNAMSPEARATAYEQLTSKDFVPTPNTARAKDDYNLAQERQQQKVNAINAEAERVYDEINTNWRGATAGEYFSYVKTGQDPRVVEGLPKRSDYKSNLAYANAVARFNNTPRATVTGDKPFSDKPRGSTGATQLGAYIYNRTPTEVKGAINYQARSFQAGFVGDPALSSSLGTGQTAGGSNFGFGLGAVLRKPVEAYAYRGAFSLSSSVTGAGYQIGSFGSTSALGAVGGTAGATAVAIPLSVGATAVVREFSGSRVDTQLWQSGISRQDFDSAVGAGLSNTGWAGELFSGFGSRKKYLEGFNADLRRKGISGSNRLNQIALQQKRVTATAELVGISVAGASANVVGARNSLVFGYSRTFGSGFGAGFKAIGLAGVTEGVGSSYAQDFARFRRFDNRRAVVSGAFGGVTAGLLGGAVTGSIAKGLGKTRRTFTALGYGIDPTEFVSDGITTGSGNFYGRVGGGVSVIASPAPLSFVSTQTNAVTSPSPSPRGSVSSSPLTFVNPSPNPRQYKAFAPAISNPNPYVAPNPNINPTPNPNPNPNPNPRVQPNPFVNPSPNPFVPVNPNPNPVVPTNPFVPVNPNPNPNPDPIVNPNPNPVVSNIIFLPFGKGQGNLSRRTKWGLTTGGRKAKYTPSFTALELGISSSKPRTKGSFTGFEIRPFISPSKSRKKNKPRKTRARKKRFRTPLFSLGLGSPI